MAHRIDIRFRHKIGDADVHKVGNFIEAVWVGAWQRGWVKLEELDGRVNSMADFGFTFRARESHEATKMVLECVRDHYMESFVRVFHSKKAKVDG
jgi:hypothetical protein